MPYGVMGTQVARESIGFVDYNDALTAISPISVPATLTDTLLTNDTLGPFTNTAHLPDNVTTIWDSVGNLFDFTELVLGSTVEIRLDIAVTTTSPNQVIEIDLELGVGGTTYQIPFVRNTFKAVGTQEVNRFNGIYMGDTNTLNNGARFLIRSDGVATVRVNGWYCKITR